MSSRRTRKHGIGARPGSQTFERALFGYSVSLSDIRPPGSRARWFALSRVGSIPRIPVFMRDSADRRTCRRMWWAPDGSVLEARRSSNVYSTASTRLAKQEAPPVADAEGGAVGLTSPNAKAAAGNNRSLCLAAAGVVSVARATFAIVSLRGRREVTRPRPQV